MSQTMKALLNAWAQQSQRATDDAMAIVRASIPNWYAPVDVLGHANDYGVVDCVNQVLDPQGRGLGPSSPAGWYSPNSLAGTGTLGTLDNDPPGYWGRSVVLTPVGGASQARLYALTDFLDSVYEPAHGSEYTVTGPITLPVATLTLPTTTGLLAAGSGYIGNQQVFWTGKTGTTLTGASGGVGTFGTNGATIVLTRALTPAWWYALVYVEQAARVALRAVAGISTDAINYGQVTVPLSAGWVLVGGSFFAQENAQYGICVETPGNATAGQRLMMTGATVALGTDPGGPFAGDAPDVQSFSYAWRGAGQASKSLRRNTTLDLLAFREAEAGLDINPVGMTVAQRADYLLRRKQARHDPAASTLVNLITLIIQADSPGFQSSGVKIVRDYVNQNFSVQIGYSPTALMADRVLKLIARLKPLGLNFTGVTWGTFIADINKAGDTL